MADIATIQKLFNKERLDGFNDFRTRAYFAGQNATLASMDLELGDNLRASSSSDRSSGEANDSEYEIVGTPVIEYSKQASQRVAIATGLKELLLKDSDGNEVTGNPWSELIQSRIITTTNRVKRYQITLTGAIDAVRPLRQHTYNDITKTNIFFIEPELVTEPEIVHVSDVQQVTRNISHVQIVLEGYYRLFR